MQYCPSCGAPVEGRFCAKCGTAVAAAAAASAGGPPPPSGAYVPPVPQSLGMDENLAAALCYIPIVGLIFLLIDPYKQNRAIRFHAWQSLFYFGGFVLIRIGLAIVWAVLRVAMPYGTWALWALLMGLVGLAYLAGLIFLAMKAYQRSPIILPIIGPIAEKQAG